MADAGLHVVTLAVGPQRRAEVVRGQGLAHRADVVLLAFHGEQHGAPDRRRFDFLILVGERAERQRVFLEYQLHGFQIKLGGEIEYGEIFVVERLGGGGLGLLAARQVLVQFLMRLQMTLDIHAHEGGELHEAGIDAPSAAGIAVGHGCDQVLLEPLHRLAFGEIVDLGRVDAGVDRAGHQRHRARLRRIVGLRHHRRRHQRGDARLAHRHQMRARPHRLEKAHDVADIFVEAEAPFRDRYVARIVPVGDVDVVLGQHGAHGGAQQCGEMSGQRRDQQHARLRLVDVLLEMQQRGERRPVGRLFADRHLAVAHHDAVDAVRRPRMGQRGARDQLVSRGEIAERRRPQRTVEPGADRTRSHVGQGPHRHHDVGMRLIRLIEHSILGGPGEPQRKASSFHVAVRDNYLDRPAWGQAGCHAFLRHGKLLIGQNFRLSCRGRAVSNRDDCARG